MITGHPILIYCDDNLQVESQTPLCYAVPFVKEIIKSPESLLDVGI